MRAWIAAAAAGLLFSLGLGLGGMTDPANVLGFLDVAGAWRPHLMFVMAGALGTLAFLQPFIRRRERPLLATSFRAHAQARVDPQLVTGAAIFGVGWGLSGYCPGPALTSLAAGSTNVLVFVAAMAAGMALYRIGEAARGAPAAVEDAC